LRLRRFGGSGNDGKHATQRHGGAGSEKGTAIRLGQCHDDPPSAEQRLLTKSGKSRDGADELEVDAAILHVAA
jgi:hypothetical protein